LSVSLLNAVFASRVTEYVSFPNGTGSPPEEEALPIRAVQNRAAKRSLPRVFMFTGKTVARQARQVKVSLEAAGKIQPLQRWDPLVKVLKPHPGAAANPHDL
jgi:hypothetical protein